MPASGRLGGSPGVGRSPVLRGACWFLFGVLEQVFAAQPGEFLADPAAFMEFRLECGVVHFDFIQDSPDVISVVHSGVSGGLWGRNESGKLSDPH